ncbi:MAG: hypothetical protein GY757_49640 [bacterium]|nr:hypothetical protein [bacterium]
MDVFSLRTNYGFLADYNGDACENTEKEKRITDGEHGLSYRGRPEGARQVVWRLRPPRKNREAEEKIFMEFSFRVEEDGYFDIHLLGIMRRGVTVYLDGEVISDGTGGIGKLSMFCLAGKDIYIAKGRHTIEMERRCHVNAVVIKESKSKDKGKELRVKS